MDCWSVKNYPEYPFLAGSVVDYNILPNSSNNTSWDQPQSTAAGRSDQPGPPQHSDRSQLAEWLPQQWPQGGQLLRHQE